MKISFVRIATAVAFSALVTTAGAAVFPPQQQLSVSILDSFKKNPSQLLADYPATETGLAGLKSRVRDLAGTDPSTLSLLIDLLKTVDPTKFTDPQKAADAKKQAIAITDGLLDVARLASRSLQEQGYGSDIQREVLAAGNPAATEEYRRLNGDVAIRSGGGGGGGAGGGGTGTGGSTGTSGFVFGGNNSGSASIFGAKNYTTSGTQSTTGSVGSVGSAGGTSNTVSCRVNC